MVPVLLPVPVSVAVSVTLPAAVPAAVSAVISAAILPHSGRAHVAVPDSVFSLLPAAASGDDPPVCSLV